MLFVFPTTKGTSMFATLIRYLPLFILFILGLHTLDLGYRINVAHRRFRPIYLFASFLTVLAGMGVIVLALTR